MAATRRWPCQRNFDKLASASDCFTAMKFRLAMTQPGQYLPQAPIEKQPF